MENRKNIPHAINNSIYQGINTLCRIFLSVQVIVLAYTVFGRFVLNKTPCWGEEMALFCMVWFSLLGISIGIKHDSHIRITVIDMLVSEKVKRILKYFRYTLLLFFAIFMVIQGWKVVMLTARRISPALRISCGWLYASLPVSGILVIITILGKFFEMSLESGKEERTHGN